MKAWYAKVSPERRRLFAGRRYRDVDLEHDVVTVTTRHGGVVFMAPTDGLELLHVRNGLLLQVLARDPERNTHVFEFRPRRHPEGRTFADALR